MSNYDDIDRPFLYDRVCPICGKEFKTDKAMKKYCSAECTIEAQKLAHKRWYRKNFKTHRDDD